MAIVSVSDNSDTTVRVSWVKPDERGSAITGYLVQFLSKDSQYTTLPECDNSIKLYCDIPMSTFLSTPMLLLQDDAIVVTIQA